MMSGFISLSLTSHITSTIEECELFDGKNFQRKPAIDLPCCDDVIVRRNLIRNSHRGVVFPRAADDECLLKPTSS